eukprot:1602317-Prymnesium_polylepis.1
MADEVAGRRPRRTCTLPAADGGTMSEPPPEIKRTRPRPLGKVLIVHSNAKPYGYGPSRNSNLTANGHRAIKAKASNKSDFDFACADYETMRDSGRPYSGDPRLNKLLPLPRPTYTEFINRAKQA